MDPQPLPNRNQEPVSQTRSLVDHFPLIPQLEFFPLDNRYDDYPRNTVPNITYSMNRTNLNSGDQSIRSELQQLSTTREAQTLMSVSRNILPFVSLFLAKVVYDYCYDIFQFALLYTVFFISDSYIQKVTSGEITSKLFQTAYCVIFSLLVVIYLQSISFEDFDFANTFGLNIFYFISGEYTTASMTSTIYGIIVVDTTFKLLTIIPKAMLLVIPICYVNLGIKRKLFQLIEYGSELYRCALPIGPWIRYFLFTTPGSTFMIRLFCSIYILIKIGEMYQYSMLVTKSAKGLFKNTSFGKNAKRNDYDDDLLCAVCHEDLQHPIKLDCNHVFCLVCIETWLDKQSTCPICRAEVKKDIDNSWKNGGTSLAVRTF